MTRTIAGPDLNTWIAQRVLGWQVQPDPRSYQGAPVIRADGQASDIPHFTTDIAAAMLVVEHLRQRGYYFRMIDEMAAAANIRIWRVTVTPDTGPPETVLDPSLPFALCVAAFRALGLDPYTDTGETYTPHY